MKLHVSEGARTRTQAQQDEPQLEKEKKLATHTHSYYRTLQQGLIAWIASSLASSQLLPSARTSHGKEHR